MNLRAKVYQYLKLGKASVVDDFHEYFVIPIWLGALSINGLKHEAAKRASEPIKGFHEGMGEETADELRARWYSWLPTMVQRHATDSNQPKRYYMFPISHFINTLEHVLELMPL